MRTGAVGRSRQNVSSPVLDFSQLDGESNRIRKALSFAREHLAEELPARRLADAACLSLRQCGRGFRRETPIRQNQRPAGAPARAQQAAGPLVGALETWLREQRARLSSQSKTAKAIAYATVRPERLVRYQVPAEKCSHRAKIHSQRHASVAQESRDDSRACSEAIAEIRAASRPRKVPL
jgi:Transposase IS66 family